MDQITHSSIAAHNDGVLNWLRGLADAVTDDGATKRFPRLSSAWERFASLTSGLIAQTGFLPSGSAAGVNQGEISKPFDFVPHPQANGYVIACANPRNPDQDTAVTMAILAAIAGTVDEASKLDYTGKDCLGGGYNRVTVKGVSKVTRVKANNPTFNTLVRELNIKKTGKTFTLADGFIPGMRAKGVPAFPADALKMFGGAGRKSRIIHLVLTLSEGKGKERKFTDVDAMFSSPDGAKAFLRVLKPIVKLAHVQDPETVAAHLEAFALLGVTLRATDDVKAEKTSNKEKQADQITSASPETLELAPAANQ